VFGVSSWELLLILAVALVVLGPRQLTETARYLGKLYRELQRMTVDLRGSLDLDEPASPGHYSPPRDKAPKQSAPAAPEPPRPGQPKSGPDFYAQLLEQSSEDGEGQERDESKTTPADPASEKPVDLTKKTT
jgi:sec-independent protein translocase protein TatB